MHADDDTIAAIATAPGAGGLAVLRVSGPGALAIAATVFRGAALGEVPSHTLHHGWIAAPPVRGAGGPERIDEVVAAVFRAPRSYTREDVVEISCHGGRLSAELILAALLAAGARLAAPGEFTLRAFLRGRVDLAQAEAVADVIAAETEAAHALAVSQLSGELSRRLDALADRVLDVLGEIEARVDFAEDVGGVEVPAHAVAAAGEVADSLAALLAGSAWGRAVREGVRVPIVGRPNAGKSSLFNALLGEERAIVTPVPGTTRDRVSEAIEIAGVRITLSDTAGLRESVEPVEAIGIERARETLAGSVAALWVVDGSAPLDRDDRAVAAALAGKRVVIALNKSDLPPAFAANQPSSWLGAAGFIHTVPVSAFRGEGLDDLRAALAMVLDLDGHVATAIGNRRHVEALERARAALERAAATAREGSPGEIVAIELRDAIAAIGEVTGRAVDAELLDRIFSRFCIGK